MDNIKFRIWDSKAEQMYDSDYADTYTLGALRNPRYKVMLYTGLKDTKGKEIYDGDIVAYRDDLYVVQWNNGHSDIGEFGDQWGDQLGWQLNTYAVNEMGYYISTPLCSDMLILVFGNLYDGGVSKLAKEIEKRVRDELKLP